MTLTTLLSAPRSRWHWAFLRTVLIGLVALCRRRRLKIKRIDGVCRTVLVGIVVLLLLPQEDVSRDRCVWTSCPLLKETNLKWTRSQTWLSPHSATLKISISLARSEADCCLFCLLPLCYRNAIPSFTSCLTQNKLASSFFQYLYTQDLFLLDVFNFCSKPVAIKTLRERIFCFCSSFSWIESM